MAKLISQKRFINEALEAHNDYRKLHGVAPLEHDHNLSDAATEWAENLAVKGQLKYKSLKYKGEILGENILKANSNYLDGRVVTDLWYDEEKEYEYDGKFNQNSGHFTQIIWKDTKKVGFGFASTEDGNFFGVVFYYPAGNYKNEFAKNVLKPSPPKYEPIGFKPFKDTNVSYDNLPVSPSNQSTNTKPSNTSFKSFDSMQNKFIYEALDAHNSCRRRHAVEPLVHNFELSKIAQEYAEYLAKLKKLTHSTNKYNDKRVGENLAFSYDSSLDYYSGEKATMQWYNEIKDHDFNRDYQPGTGHFTQVVWKSSKEVGFGVARASDGSFYAVGNYHPAGNLLGTFIKNVPRNLN